MASSSSSSSKQSAIVDDVDVARAALAAEEVLFFKVDITMETFISCPGSLLPTFKSHFKSTCTISRTMVKGHHLLEMLQDCIDTQKLGYKLEDTINHHFTLYFADGRTDELIVSGERFSSPLTFEQLWDEIGSSFGHMSYNKTREALHKSFKNYQIIKNDEQILDLNDPA